MGRAAVEQVTSPVEFSAAGSTTTMVTSEFSQGRLGRCSSDTDGHRQQRRRRRRQAATRRHTKSLVDLRGACTMVPNGPYRVFSDTPSSSTDDWLSFAFRRLVDTTVEALPSQVPLLTGTSTQPRRCWATEGTSATALRLMVEALPTSTEVLA